MTEAPPFPHEGDEQETVAAAITSRPLDPQESSDTGPRFQADVIGVGNIAIGIVTVVALRSAYDVQRLPPIAYDVSLGAVLLLFAVYFRFDKLAQWAGETTDGLGGGRPQPEYELSPRMQRAVAWRDRHAGVMVYVLASGTIISLIALIVQTGMGMESPFIPFLTAPAVFGPFVAKNSQRVTLLVGVLASILLVITFAFSSSPCGVGGCQAPTPAQIRVCEVAPNMPRTLVERCAERAVEDSFRPRGWLFFVTSVIVLVVAGLIAARRLRNEQQLISEIERRGGEGRPAPA